MKVGEHSGKGPVAASLDILWDMQADKALIAPKLQYHYVLQDALDIWLGLGQGTQVRVGTRMVTIDDEKLRNLRNMREVNAADLEKVERQARAGRPAVVSSIAATAPITPASDPLTAQRPDPNARRFRGDPLYPDTVFPRP